MASLAPTVLGPLIVKSAADARYNMIHWGKTRGPRDQETWHSVRDHVNESWLGAGFTVLDPSGENDVQAAYGAATRQGFPAGQITNRIGGRGSGGSVQSVTQLFATVWPYFWQGAAAGAGVAAGTQLWRRTRTALNVALRKVFASGVDKVTVNIAIDGDDPTCDVHVIFQRVDADELDRLLDGLAIHVEGLEDGGAHGTGWPPYEWDQESDRWIRVLPR